MKGTVKWFNEVKGYGFIIGDDNQDYFAHFSHIKMTGRKNLIEGQQVEFEASKTERGLNAKEITIIG